jgi:serine/threonine protein kinase
MEACRGPTVKAVLDVAAGPLNESDAAFLLQQAATTIQQLHSIGVLHRDVKPDNFMFYKSDVTSPLVVIDFGLSLLLGNLRSYQSKWTVGSLLYVRRCSFLHNSCRQWLRSCHSAPALHLLPSSGPCKRWQLLPVAIQHHGSAPAAVAQVSKA